MIQSTENHLAKDESISVQQIVVFKLGKEEYGLPIDQIKEVVQTPTITKMPQTPGYVKGVANIRGNIIAILDLEEKFGIANTVTTSAATNFTLVIESEEFKLGILVREVPNTLTIKTSQIEPTVFMGEQQEQSYITGIIKLEKRLIIMIDIFRVIGDQQVQQTIKKSATQPALV